MREVGSRVERGTESWTSEMSSRTSVGLICLGGVAAVRLIRRSSLSSKNDGVRVNDDIRSSSSSSKRRSCYDSVTNRSSEDRREIESYLGEDRNGEGGELAVIGTAEESDYRWCISESDIPDFLMLYFDQPDKEGHEYGPDDLRVTAAVGRVDRMIGRVIQGLKKREIFDEVNVILLGDHGMVTNCDMKTIYIDDLAEWVKIPADWINAYSPVLAMNPKWGDETKNWREIDINGIDAPRKDYNSASAHFLE
ncbi:hypothetical protein DY000_02058498 [Brassica cretica]|uniref:Uncharacterized protein n=1 Tax=Brassica cretica TaxID=69181 RepID=A0ABQ7AYV5_BRACR|nr:hypothetical protein DY000_02058498 [Brassica cretica]